MFPAPRAYAGDVCVTVPLAGASSMARGGASRLAPGLRGKILYGSYQRSATCCGSIQVASAVLWMIALGVSFSIALGGLPGVEKCMEKPLLPPPSPPPPRPPPEDVRHGGCPSECRGPAMLSARSGGLVSNGICETVQHGRMPLGRRRLRQGQPAGPADQPDVWWPGQVWPCPERE